MEDHLKKIKELELENRKKDSAIANLIRELIEIRREMEVFRKKTKSDIQRLEAKINLKK